MEGLKRVGKYLFLETQETTMVGATWRAAELASGKISKNYLADVIDPKLVNANGFLDHYLNQSMVSSKLEHPNILKRVNTLNEGGEVTAIYEHMEGFSLARVLDRCQSDGFPFSIDHALLVVSKLLAALSYARGKHVSHGFVNPAMVLITHEGEVKVKGFALSAAIHASSEATGAVDPSYQYYVPSGGSLSGDRDRNDIYACGAILFEMLTGEKFNQLSGDSATLIAGASMEADGEQIPTQIANILVSSLDTGAPTAYQDTQKMSADLEELLYSGEYSPTTFNLAFFMHSAFREEMEALGEKIAAEKERDFSDMGTMPGAATVSGPSGEAPPPPRAAAAAVETTPVETSSEQKKSPMGMIIGIVAAVVILGGIGWFMMNRGGSDTAEEDPFAAEQVRLKEENKKLEEDRLRQQQEELAQQNELLRQQLLEQRRVDEERKKQKILEDMQKMDEEIARIKKMQEQEAKQKEMADQLAQLMKEKQEIEARKRQQEEEAAKRKAEEEAAAKLAAQQKKAEEEAKKAETSGDEPAEDLNMPTQPPEEEVVIVPPKEGDLVPIDDPLLQYPQLLESYSIQDAPRKAVRNDVVPKGKIVTFLMRALINEKGDVEEVVLHRNPLNTGQDDYGMIARAEKVAGKARFAPATKLGVKVKVWMIVSVSFRGE